MLDYFSSLLFGKKSNLPNVDEAPAPSPPHKPRLTAVPAPLKPQRAPELLTRNWSHPFGDRSHPLQQLTQLANASAGYYPVGVNGTWHGGVHFDHGTAGALDQSRVLCLADGEVVAWRIPTNTPTTRYFPAAGVTLDAPCASGFVLVRHRIQAPAIEGCDQVPPDLTFYSLYMHLEDWTAYQDGRQDRPAFWPQSKIMWVRDDASDVRPGSPTERGARTIHSDWQPQTLDFLPRGTQVTVGSAQGRYLTLEDAVAPLSMLAADGSLPGYIAFKSLVDNGKGLYRVAGDGRIRAAGHVDSKVLGRLHQHTLVRISGEGDFRKLERVVPLVEAAALRGERKPTVFDRVFVPETPIPVMAGELIGHIGPYQESNETTAQRKLHLEVFCEEDFSVFLKASRAWAERLPADEKTWLKLVKGTRVVPHQSGYGDKWQPAWEGPHQLSGADLLVPKSLLDNLPPEKRISAAATQFGKPRNWYYLEGLLNDADGTMVDGWVLEVVGETPWVSPWHWDGYDVIRNSSTPTQGHAYRLSLRKDLSEEHLARLRPHADQWDEGPLQSRLYDLIDRNRDGIMSAAEIRMAMKVPAHAQSLSKIVLHCESEWEYSEEKWDALDDIFGHTTSAPILNWVAEKERIKLLSWWEEAGRELGFWLRRPVYFLQPIGLAGHFLYGCICGCCKGPAFSTVRYGNQYGPVLWGSMKMADFRGMADLVSTGEMSDTEREIIAAMSENEGNMDALQSYDSEVLTAGSMQKTVKADGSGELSTQIEEFKISEPLLYRVIFENCGWTTRVIGGRAYLYYEGNTGSELKKILREGFDKAAFEKRSRIPSASLAALALAIKNENFLKKQVIDFVFRLRKSNSLSPQGFSGHMVSDYVKSKLGKALVLDQHVNRPAFVAKDFGAALKVFFERNSTAPKSPSAWGEDHSRFEMEIIEYYGVNRRMTHAKERYLKLRRKL